jgi:hypothetical protein
VREQLANGPKPRSQIEAAVKAADIPERSLIVAADMLGVRTQKGQWYDDGKRVADTLAHTHWACMPFPLARARSSRTKVPQRRHSIRMCSPNPITFAVVEQVGQVWFILRVQFRSGT